MRVISWNIAHRVEPWRTLVNDETFDVALLQEAAAPP